MAAMSDGRARSQRVIPWPALLFVIVVVLSTAPVLSAMRKDSVRSHLLISPTGTVSSGDEEVLQLYSHPERWSGVGWLKHLDPLRLAPLTQEAQHWIYAQQHPRTPQCANASSLVKSESNTNRGLGSELHVAGRFLGYALEHGLLFVWDTSAGSSFVEGGCGRGMPYTSLECLFERPSSCPAESASASKDFGGRDIDNGTAWAYGSTPTHLKRRLEETFAQRGVRVSQEFVKYWWRAQSAAYLARLNAETRSAVAAMRMNASAVRASVVWQGQERKDVQVGFPLPPGSVHVHVREGAKASEMKLYSFRQYINKAEQLVDQNPLHLKKQLLLTADNPGVYKEVAALMRVGNGTSPDGNWVSMTANVPEPQTNGEWVSQLAAFGKQHVKTHLLKLLLALECDAWVHTRGSNWNRLIDELRCVWVAKCPYPYVEIGEEATNWKEYSW